MLPESELTRLLKSSESHWVERKPPGVSVEKIRNTLVAFANSIAIGQHAVLFIGLSDDGKPLGVDNAAQKQKDVRQIAEHRCYPPIKCEPTVFQVDGVEIVAVVVEASNDRPHFSGHPYVRVGSETKKADMDQFEEMIVARNNKVRQILREKGKIATIFWEGKEAPFVSSGGWIIRMPKRRFASSQQFEAECRITACDILFLRVSVIAVRTDAGYNKKNSPMDFSVPVDKVSLGFDNENQRMKLHINY